MNKNVLLIRHGESTKNIQDLFGDENSNFQLTEKGKLDSTELANFIKETAVQLNQGFVIFTSPDSRSMMTAEIVCEILGCNFIIKETLLPIKAGKLSGISENEASKLYPELMRLKTSFRKGELNGYEISYPDGENVSEFQDRIIADFLNILSHPKELIFILSHQSVITAILSFCKSIMKNENYYYYFKLSLCGKSKVTINNSNYSIGYIDRK